MMNKQARHTAVKKISLALFAAFAITFMSGPASALSTYGAYWEVPITVSAGAEDTALYFGSDLTATNGFDNRWETRALLGGSISAYFFKPEYPFEMPYFWSDFRPLTLPQEWVFSVSPQSSGVNITLTWDMSRAVQSGVVYALTDTVDGVTLDMLTQSSYTYTASNNSPRDFTVSVTGTLPALPNAVAPNTSIVSAPAQFSGADVTISFTGTDDDTPSPSLMYSVSVDGGPWSAPSAATSLNLTGLSDATHSVSVRAIDAAQNVDQTPASVVFTVDTIAPVLAVGAVVSDNPSAPSSSSSLPEKRKNYVLVSGITVDTSLSKLEYTLYDEYGKFGDSGTIKVAPDGSFSLPLRIKTNVGKTDADGVRTYTLTVRSVDKAGNVSVYSVVIK